MGAAMFGSTAFAPHAAANPSTGRARGREVAIFGGGMAGLSAAHELIERGYSVTVYEPSYLGGKARSMPVVGTGKGGRQDLPGEHGFRFFPGCYQHVPNTMSRIPVGDSNVKAAHLVSADALTLGLYGADYRPVIMPASRIGIKKTADTTLQLKNIQNAFIDMFASMKNIPMTEQTYAALRMTVMATSCQERRIGQWDNVSWMNYIKAYQMSADYRTYLATSFTSSLVAAKAQTASARTIGQTALALAYAGSGPLVPQYANGLLQGIDRLLNRPTNEAWIDPWVRYLTSRGVRFVMNTGLSGLRVSGRRITETQVTTSSGATSSVVADWYMTAMPVDRLKPLLTPDVLRAAPGLAGVRQLVDDWMVGIQYYLRKRAGTPTSHIALLGAPWSLTAIFQAEPWGQDIGRTYGDGEVQEILSVDISNWDVPGVLYGKTAKQCTAEEISREVWEQLRRGLNRGGYRLINDDELVRWHLDPGVTWRNGKAFNATPLLVNTAGSYPHRPTAETEISNLFIGGDHVRSNIDLATMEGANESGRRVANAILDRTDSNAERAAIYPLWEPELMDPLKDLDRDRWRQGLPHILDV
ncbi:FAD-dependent oxidoreductase [Jongsikchunia kroppenstedtii]|uniref:hydroxysqualene dehydroxylase n=1 Tax=Jongsikchunia kroppenstedtii TaxID=1121721 RepID=UPI00037C4B81